MGSNVWLTFLAEIWVAGVMGYLALSLRHEPRLAVRGGDAAFVGITLVLAAAASVALMFHAVLVVAGVSR